MSSPSEQASPTDANNVIVQRKVNPKRGKLLGLAVASLCLLSAGCAWLYERSHTVQVADARVASKVISLSAETAGRITDFPVHRGQAVKKGDLLAVIDRRDAELRLAEIDIEIEVKKTQIERASARRDMTEQTTGGDLKASEARVLSAIAELNRTQVELKTAQANFNRANKLLDKKLISTYQWEQAELGLNRASLELDRARADVASRQSEQTRDQAKLRELIIQDREILVMSQQLEHLKLQRERQLLDLTDREIRSPIDAVVDNTFPNAGEYVSVGRRLMMLHDPADIWIDANIKETEIRHVEIGSTAKVSVDAYPGMVFDAVVERIDNATTSEYALLPNPNPSGNFTKVTQRVSVRLAIQQQDNLLKPGMMVEVKIDSRG